MSAPTASQIMQAAFKRSLEIVDGECPPGPGGSDANGRAIAASNMAIALFAFEAEQASLNPGDDGEDEGTIEDG